MYNVISIILSVVSVLIGLYSIWISTNAKKAVAQIRRNDLKLKFSIRLNGMRECTYKNLIDLYELQSEIIKNERLTFSRQIRATRDSIEPYVRHRSYYFGRITDEQIVLAYQRAYAATAAYVGNIDTESF